MPTDFWSEDDRPTSAPSRRWRWWQVAALTLVILLAVVAVFGFFFPEVYADRWHEWQVRQFRQDILKGNLSPEALRDDLLKRNDGLLIALRLSEDPDPRVRAASIDRLVARGTPVLKQELGDGRVDHLFTTLGDHPANEALLRLLDDPDPTVRKRAIVAVSSIQEKLAFTEKLLVILNGGSTEERILVAAHLANWNGDQALKTFADKRQPKEVRFAALNGANRLGWARLVEDEGEFVRVMKQVQSDPDADIRWVANDSLKHSRTAAPK